MYTRKPIDTSGVELPEGLLQLIERLAENAHDTWASQRTKEGWTYGLKRDDSAKKHPDLVPYNDLPDSEKNYDRAMAIETIKLILASGYRIERI